jgi:hypothetical protein
MPVDCFRSPVPDNCVLHGCMHFIQTRSRHPDCVQSQNQYGKAVKWLQDAQETIL